MDNNLINTSKYLLPKDVDGNIHATSELHNIILRIVLEFDRICRKNNIDYALGFGSAIGLVNYKGFIPWDDDADIVIKYEDINRLVEALEKDLSNEFSFECFEIDKRYNVLIPTMKIRYKNSYILEANHINLPNRCKHGDGFFVDVCAFMGVPSDKKKHRKLLKKSKFWMPLMVFLESYLHIPVIGIKKSLKKYERKIAEQYKDSAYVSQTVIIPFQDWQVDCFVDSLAFPKDVIFPFKEYEFEGHKLFSFNKPEEFVKLRYGKKAIANKDKFGNIVDDYPEEKRTNHHIKKYSLNKSKGEIKHGRRN